MGGPVFLMNTLPPGADPENLFGGGITHGERVEREPITGVWGRAPSGVQRQSPWWGLGGEAPLKLKAFWLLNVPRSRKIDPDFVFFAKC